MRFKSLVVAICLLISSSVTAGELTLALGEDDLKGRRDSKSTMLNFWYFGRQRGGIEPFYWGYGAVIEGDTDRDFFIGGGVYAGVELWPRIFLDFSIMPGYYQKGPNGTLLGHPIEFWSHFGFSYAINPTTRIGVAASHKSNRDLGDFNSGVESIHVTFSKTLKKR